jgi:Holliday junction resolvase RusA-like endonuclease
MKSLSIKLLGAIPSKKNTWKRGIMGLYIPPITKKLLDDLLWQLKKHHPKKPIEKGVTIKMVIYTKTMRQDAGNISETILDLLQKAAILKNDRLADDVHYTRARGAEDIAFIDIAI